MFFFSLLIIRSKSDEQLSVGSVSRNIINDEINRFSLLFSLTSLSRVEKDEINQLEPYLDKRTGFTWLPSTDTDYHQSEWHHLQRKFVEEQREMRNIPDYLLWSIGNFFLFFVFGIVCLILSVRVREAKREEDYHRAQKFSHRTLFVNILTTIVGLTFLVTMLAILINKSSSNF